MTFLPRAHNLGFNCLVHTLMSCSWIAPAPRKDFQAHPDTTTHATRHKISILDTKKIQTRKWEDIRSRGRRGYVCCVSWSIPKTLGTLGGNLGQVACLFSIHHATFLRFITSDCCRKEPSLILSDSGTFFIIKAALSCSAYAKTKASK